MVDFEETVIFGILDFEETDILAVLDFEEMDILIYNTLYKGESSYVFQSKSLQTIIALEKEICR